jgi:hypothetical protein
MNVFARNGIITPGLSQAALQRRAVLLDNYKFQEEEEEEERTHSPPRYTLSGRGALQYKSHQDV